MTQNDRGSHRFSGTLFTDLDDTFFHPDVPTETWRLYNLCAQKQWRLIYVTGNGLLSILPRIKSKQIPAPHIIAGHVGTDIWELTDASSFDMAYVHNEEYSLYLGQRGYDRKEIVKKSFNLINKIKNAYPAVSFHFQEPQNEKDFLAGNIIRLEPYKVSFTCIVDRPDTITAIVETLRSTFSPHKVILSDNTSWNRVHSHGKESSFCIDVLAASKGYAVNYLIDTLHIERGIVAGDSGNDIEMLKESSSKITSILVGGAKQEALSEFRRRNIARIDEWDVSLCSTENKALKLCFIDTSSSRVGPQSIAYAMRYM